jgi:hypothetical protein
MLKALCQFYEPQPDWTIEFNNKVNIAGSGRRTARERTEQPYSPDAVLAAEWCMVLLQESDDVVTTCRTVLMAVSCFWCLLFWSAPSVGKAITLYHISVSQVRRSRV